MGTPQPVSPDANGSAPRPLHRDLRVLALAGAAFWGLALVFAVIPTRDPIPRTERTMVSAEEIDPSPRFVPMGDDAVALISVFPRKCMDCHGSLVGTNKLRLDTNHYHDTVNMDHGLNGRCVNCHDTENRNMLVLRDGETIGFSQSTTLCSNCHGPAFRQWQRGVHGKTLGYWSAEWGDPRKLQCVECHNPHSPHYDPMAPLPAPNTLRMGDQNPDGPPHGSGGDVSPLMRTQSGEEHGAPHGAPQGHSKE